MKTSAGGTWISFGIVCLGLVVLLQMGCAKPEPEVPEKGYRWTTEILESHNRLLVFRLRLAARTRYRVFLGDDSGGNTSSLGPDAISGESVAAANITVTVNIVPSSAPVISNTPSAVVAQAVLSMVVRSDGATTYAQAELPLTRKTSIAELVTRADTGAIGVTADEVFQGTAKSERKVLRLEADGRYIELTLDVGP